MTEVHHTAVEVHLTTVGAVHLPAAVTVAEVHIHPEVHRTAAEVHHHRVVATAEAQVHPVEDTEDKPSTTKS